MPLLQGKRQSKKSQGKSIKNRGKEASEKPGEGRKEKSKIRAMSKYKEQV